MQTFLCHFFLFILFLFLLLLQSSSFSSLSLWEREGLKSQSEAWLSDKKLNVSQEWDALYLIQPVSKIVPQWSSTLRIHAFYSFLHIASGTVCGTFRIQQKWYILVLIPWKAHKRPMASSLPSLGHLSGSLTLGETVSSQWMRLKVGSPAHQAFRRWLPGTVSSLRYSEPEAPS